MKNIIKQNATNTMNLNNILMEIGISEKSAYLIVHRSNMISKCKKEKWNKYPDSYNFILNCLIECTLDLKSFTTEILLLSKYLVSKEDKLSHFDYGRFLHMKAIKGWRIEKNIFDSYKYLNNSIEVLSKLQSKASKYYLSRVHDTYGQILAANGNLIDAREEFMRALDGRDPVNDLFGKALTLGNLGRLHMQLGDFKQAIHYLSEDLKIIEKTGNNNLFIKAQLLSTISMCYIELEDLATAKKYNEKSYEINKKLQSAIGSIYNRLNSANISLKNNHIAIARNKLLELKRDLNLGIIQSSFKQYFSGKIFHLEAYIYYHQNNYGESNRCFQEAMAIFSREQVASPVESAIFFYNYAQLIVKTGNMDLAGELYRKSLRYFDLTEENRNREIIESEMKVAFKESWIIHSAGRFLGHEQINFLLNDAGKGDYSGEEKDVVVLFADIRGFTSISEKLFPRQLLDLLNKFLALMTKSIEYYGGFIDKFIGDSVMAVFGLPNSSPPGSNGDSEKAIMAALMMIEELKRFNRNLPYDLPSLKIGIGIHCGNVIAGLIGSPQKRSFTVIGDVANTASRLEGMTNILGAQILISKEVCLRITRKDVLVRSLGRYCPKGREHFVEVFEILGTDDNSPRLDPLKNECKMAHLALTHFYAKEFKDSGEIYNMILKNTKSIERSKAYKLLSSACQEFETLSVSNSWKGEIKLKQKN